MHCVLRILYILAIPVLCCACARPKYESLEAAAAQGARLGEYIYIDGVDVSGMALQEAEDALAAAQQAALEGRSVQLINGEETLELSLGELPISFNREEVLLQALSLPPHVPKNSPRELSCRPSADLESLRVALLEQTDPLNAAPQDAVAVYDPEAEGNFVIQSSAAGRQVDVQALAQELQGRIESGDLTSPLPVSFVELPPEYTTEQAEAEHQLITEFSTSFAGSTYSKENRVFNISKAADLMDGTVLSPGEEFDMNAVLGDRNEENGWKTAAGIRDGAYVQEYGGGVCQVSTTLYNAVLMADLEITERHHHSWPLGYIDPGRDATISTGGPNFRFRNTSAAPITLSASVDAEEKTITVRIYGQPLADGVSIRLRSEKTATLEDLGTEYTVDPALAPGEVEEVRKSRRGCIAITWKEYYDAEGNLLREEQVTEDKYRSIQGLVKISG